MGGFFGVASKEDCVFDLFFGTDYHSHLGTRRAGMAVYGKDGFEKAIHKIENAPFRTKFDKEANTMHGNMGIGCISDYEAQPILVRSHHGSFAITTVGKINNADTIIADILKNNTHFFEMSNGEINATELVAAIINQKENFIDGIRYAQELIEGSMSMLILTPKGVYCARDRFGRTPVVIGKKDGARCAAFESFSFLNLGYTLERELGPGEIVVMTPDSARTLAAPGNEMKICTFLWIYYGYPSSTYEGVNVEEMRYKCGRALANRDDDVHPDIVAGVPDSGTAHAIGYANASGVPFSRPFIKYTPTWPRSFMPTIQSKRNLIAKMKLLPVEHLIKDKSLVIIDDSIVRGTQLRETTEFLYESGAKEVHIRPACPPLIFGCKYLNFSRTNSEMELITRAVIAELEGGEVTDEILKEYADPNSEKYEKMVDKICEKLNFTSLRFHRLDDMIESVGIDPCKLCTYCWSGKE
ncbi:MAG: amidophosphoribosyltransferase [Clostridium sp.]|nr:amidophosphoribosyltransferase [Clostridium sp.]MCM1172881.1 amidophosphoribosyltransferase [Clostridium sp.]MCM1209210.1 amidophosphoribosyltransferase [Ruminococcus sp.]